MLSNLLAEFLDLDLEGMRPVGFQAHRVSEKELSVNRVNDGSGWLRRAACPVCGGIGSTPLFDCRGIQILRCTDCATGYTEQIPKDLHDVYAGTDYVQEAHRSYSRNQKYRMTRFGAERIRLIRNLITGPPAQTRLLDVGCGTGWFLECALEAGFAVKGQELGPELAAETEDRLGIQVFRDPVEELDASLQFDVITLFDVIEHVPDPVGMLRHARALLAEGGLLVIFTPNYESIGFRLLQADASLVTPAEHLCYFCRQSLEWIAESLELDVRLFETRGADMADLFAYHRHEDPQSQVGAFLRDHARTFQAAIDAGGCANHLRIVLRKRGPGQCEPA